MRSLRELARTRSQLVRPRTMYVLAVENLVARQTGGRMSVNAVKQRKRSLKELALIVWFGVRNGHSISDCWRCGP
jgi:hypothetical protein